MEEAYPGSAQECKEFSARDKVHDHVEIGSILESAPDVDDERALD